MPITLESGTYELIRNRLGQHADALRSRLDTLNQQRKEVFGAVETQLIATGRITTANNCMPVDMAAVGHRFLFGYNVFLGLRSEIRIEDVFALYRFEPADHSFHEEAVMNLVGDRQFLEDYQNLYKYYKDTIFAKFALIGPNLFMVFRVGKSDKDIKTFKWARTDEGLTYLGNRFDHEVRYPDQHEFVWQRTTRDMQRRGQHPHISILDRVFVETIGGDLTIKIEDNTDSGKGIYSEPVDHKDQTLDDAEFAYADLGNLIVLRIRPYQEKIYRYFIYNEKIREVLRVDSLEHACVLLPDGQGIVFANGYYLQSGEYKLFDTIAAGPNFEKRIVSTNGEDFLYVFNSPTRGEYVLLPYNLVEQQVQTPIVCHGYTIFPSGELCYFRAEAEPGRHHVIQVWQTPYGSAVGGSSPHADTWLYKVGNKDLVRGMAECRELLTLLSKDDNYGNLYVDLVKKTSDILDAYYWIARQETGNLAAPLRDIREAAASAIDEYEKVRKLRDQATQALQAARDKVDALTDRVRRHKAQRVDQFVGYLSELRTLRGELISLRDLRYMDIAAVDALEQRLVEQTQVQSEACVQFLLDPASLAPYEQQVETTRTAVAAVAKVSEADAVQAQVDEIARQLELLIDTVSNLRIQDATETTRIIDNVSAIYAHLNALRAQLRQRRQELRGNEAGAEFAAQLKLLGQAATNYLDLCDSPQRTEEYLTKLMVQVEELEGKFSEYDDFVVQLATQRDEFYNAFEARRLQLLETRNKRADGLMRAADRILKGIQSRAGRFAEVNEINAYFAGDLMVGKVRDIIAELERLEDSVKAGDLQTKLKTLREDAVRQLKDRQDLFEGGDNVIRLGRHSFAVNTQPLDLTMLPREGRMYVHLTGTQFFSEIDDEAFAQTRPVWDQALVSEDATVYRAEYLAYRMWETGQIVGAVPELPELEAQVRTFMANRYQEGYVKGVHDHDATQILAALLDLGQRLDLLRYDPEARACANLYWHGFARAEEKRLLNSRIKGAGHVLRAFPGRRSFPELVEDIAENIRIFNGLTSLFAAGVAQEAATYLFDELAHDDSFVISQEAGELYKGFVAYLKRHKLERAYQQSLAELTEAPGDRFVLIRHWIAAYVAQEGISLPPHSGSGYVSEAAALCYSDNYDAQRVLGVQLVRDLAGMRGEHGRIAGGTYQLDYHDFVRRLRHYVQTVVPLFERFGALKQERTEAFRRQLRLDEFRPRVLSSFVRNQLIDKVYLPLFGDNFAKQLGTAGANTRTDRQGLLLLISPPGYGKTTLMEYVASRLGLIFMKINGPAIGHQVTSLDPAEASNAAAREEVEKLNLALEMGDNLMLYLDDIQHCNPEFLQKFISLCDAQRRIEGVWRGHTRTYDLRGRKVAIVMAGNPYTESGEKFRIPDMLSNRADTYNLGDIIGDSAAMFKLSYIENALTANPVLNSLATRPQEDIYALIQAAETGTAEGLNFASNISSEEAGEYLSVLRKLLRIRDVVLCVNQQYILSAGQQDLFRTEPPFLLQGSYRNMGRLAEKVLPIMNDAELDTLIRSHYEGEAQTLTTAAEANLLRFKQMNGYASEADQARWAEICQIYLREKALSADRMAQLVQEMGNFSQGLTAIREVLEKGIGCE
ncbi:MAG: DNA repair ATPase [Bacteroidia bacterium]